MVAIANATTTVGVEKSAAECTGLLRRAGARTIQMTYGETGEAPEGLSFELRTPRGSRVYDLPVRTDGVLAVLRRDAPPRHSTPAHAARVAWRIAYDWLRAQVALIEAGQATTEQVMLPYLVVDTDHDTGRAVTVWDRYVAQGGPLALTTGGA